MKRGLRIISILGELLRYFSILCVIPIPIALAYDTADLSLAGLMVPRSIPAFALTALLSWTTGTVLRFASRSVQHQDLSEQESYTSVAVAWLALTLMGSVPIVAHVGNPVDAWFESMSAMTTTGATILVDIDNAAPSLLFWRAFLQFVAGFAVVVVGVALLSRLTHGGSQLLASDIGGGGRLRPRIRETMTGIWRIYATFFAGTAFLYILTMRFTGIQVPWDQALFDGILHAFTTVSTGGFSTHNESIGYYESIAVEAVAIIFMIVAATSFALWFKAQRRAKEMLRDEEWRFYMLLALAGSVIVWLLILIGDDVSPRLDESHLLLAWRSGVFTLISMGTTTGYVVADHDSWPALARMFLIVAMFIGGMAGSTAGGMKTLRVVMLMKVVRRELQRLLHPRAVIPIRVGNRTVEEQTLLTVIAFFFSYITIWMLGSAFFTAMEPNINVLEGGAAAAAALGNIGPAMGILGPFNSYAELHASSKLVLTGLMWVGRVEIFSVLLLLGGARFGR